MLSPKRTKFRKQHRGRMRGVASKGNTIAFGQFALQAQDCGWVTARQIEASMRASGKITDQEIAIQEGDLIIAKNVVTEARRIIGSANDVLTESTQRRVLKG